jgi:hypothetical protein
MVHHVFLEVDVSKDSVALFIAEINQDVVFRGLLQSQGFGALEIDAPSYFIEDCLCSHICSSSKFGYTFYLESRVLVNTDLCM